MSLLEDYALTPQELQRVLHVGTGATFSVIDRTGRFRYVNAGFARAFKMPAADVIGRFIADLYSAETMHVVTPLIERALQGEIITYERVGRIHEDDKAWITVNISPWRAESGEILGVVTSTMRVHELRVANEKLQAAKQRLASHVENSPLTVLELDGALCVTRCSARAETMLGIAPEQLLGQPLAALLGDQLDAAPLSAALLRLSHGVDLRSETEIAFTKPGGEQVYLKWFGSALVALTAPGSPGAPDAGVLCLVEDITAKRRAEQQLLHLVTHDPLTGLVNRRGLADSLEQMLRAADGTAQVSCLYIDLDGFKEINDQHGHAAGDAVLVEVAQRFRAALPPGGVAARVGGDEFVVLMKGGVHASAVSEVSAQLLQLLREPCSFNVNGQTVSASVGASIGAASHPPHPANATELIKQADAAMYRAKRGGKNRMVLAASA